MQAAVMGCTAAPSVPGDAECHEIAPCGVAPFGGIPVEGNSQFVDQSFAGVSDGTQASPWVTISEAVVAAAPGAIVAIAPGTYTEGVTLTKPVRLWGLCPGAVTLASPMGMIQTVMVQSSGSGSELRNLAVTSTRIGIAVLGAQALLDGLWLHDTANAGLVMENVGGPTAVTLSSSLVENVGGNAVHAVGTTLEVRAPSCGTP